MSRKEPKGSPKSNQSKQKSLERKNAQANRPSKHIDPGRMELILVRVARRVVGSVK